MRPLATIVLVGVQPSLMQVPPGYLRSMVNTRRPVPASSGPKGTAAWPAPMMMAS